MRPKTKPEIIVPSDFPLPVVLVNHSTHTKHQLLPSNAQLIAAFIEIC